MNSKKQQQQPPLVSEGSKGCMVDCLESRLSVTTVPHPPLSTSRHIKPYKSDILSAQFIHFNTGG